jgi:hypothetical protein
MATSRIVPAVTLAVLVALLIVGSVVGWRALTAPLPEEPDDAAAAPAGCSSALPAGDPVRISDVRVSVFNAGSRQGLAGDVQQALTERGFIPGEVDNAPAEIEVRRVTVFASDAADPAARLVARHFGKQTPVKVSTENLGPGVDVVIGDAYKRLATGAPREITAKVAGSGC